MNRPISVFGTGYVGLSMAACFASRGLPTTCFDVDERRVESVSQGKTPFSEPGLDELVAESVANGLLKATTDPTSAVLTSGITFVTVGTPSKRDGGIDLGQVKNASRLIGKALASKGWHLVVVKSTVIPGTTDGIVRPIIERVSGKRCPSDFGLCVNPEFLREGCAVQDNMKPDRIVIGEVDSKSGEALKAFYREFYGEMPPTIDTSAVNAELIKYVNNAFLATKVSFINMIANLCQTLPGADVEEVARGIGLDRRISPSFLNAGLGYGGSCFPKDIKALLTYAGKLKAELPILRATVNINELQPLRAVEMAEKSIGKLKGRRIAVLGLSFKPNTDDVREAVSIKIVKELLRRRALVTVYDPVAAENARGHLGNRVLYTRSSHECIQDADCCIIVTEWDEFSDLSPADFKSKMRRPVIIDGRRALDKMRFAATEYSAIGLGPSVHGENINRLQLSNTYDRKSS
jgi:UDPglucose 6-dehydrogenase